ncbi:MAG TPA: hypothetical protein DEA08_36725 [Planctomycetes bacterium]|nr:hypothetical protein [Planctomycetota bacterium]
MSPLVGLGLSLALVIGGYVLAQHLEQRERLRSFLDGFVLVMVAGLCLLFILPHAFSALGGWAVGLMALGFLVPTLSERFLHRHEGEGPPVFLTVALFALGAHCALDGAVLAESGAHAHGAHDHAHGHEANEMAAMLAILVHRLPVGLFLGSTVRQLAGKRWGLVALAVVLGSTVGGHVLHEVLEAWAQATSAGVLNALLAGGLLHVVVGHGADSPKHQAAARQSSALGALLAAALFLVVPLELPQPLRVSLVTAYHLFCESAPAILLGFLGAGLLSLVSQHKLASFMTGKTALGSAARGVVFGLPIPICSCGVVPLYRGLMLRGVPAAAAVAFLIATPELGLDSIFLSFPLLGWKITALRFASAVVLALVAGSAVAWLTRKDAPVPPDPVESGRFLAASATPARVRVWRTFVESLDELGPWMVAGIAVAAAIYPLLDEATVAGVPSAAQVPLFSLISAPIYLCAASATPVASVLLAKGVALGAVITFLLTGPATNITTYGALRGFHGRKTTLLLLGVILSATIALGLVLNLVVLPLPALKVGAEHQPHALQLASASLFVAFLVYSLFRQGPRGCLQRLGIGHTHAEHDHGDRAGGHAHDHAHEGGHDHAHAREPEPKAGGCCSGIATCASEPAPPAPAAPETAPHSHEHEHEHGRGGE